MIKTSQFFPFRFPLTRIRACFSVRTSPPFLSAEKTFHRLFYLLYLIPPLSSSSLSSSLPCCVLFLFRLAFFLSPPSLFFFISHSLSLSTLLPPPFFFKSIRTLCVHNVGYNAEHRETFFLSQSSPSLFSSSFPHS